MAEIDLLRRYPRAKRNIEKRTVAQNEENIRIAWQYGREYFDGSWDTGYGGYRYDGRWLSIAEDMIAHFGLKPGDRVLDVGACKGFLVKDLKKACPDLEAFGLNISEYALMHCEPEVVGGCISGIASNCRSPTAALRRRTRSMSSTISIAPSASQRCARSSGCRSDAPTSGRSVQHARPEGDFPQLGASRPCRRASAVQGGGLYRRLLLDDYRVNRGLCYQNLPVTIVGMGARVIYSDHGGTHHTMAVRQEDIDLNPHYRFVVDEWPWVQPYLADGFKTENARSIRDRSFNLYLNENYGEAEANDTVEAILKVERWFGKAD